MAAWAPKPAISPDPNYSRSIEDAGRIFAAAKDGAGLIILGINAYHADAAACILRDGVLLAAAEEERFRRLKHWAGFPARRGGPAAAPRCRSTVGCCFRIRSAFSIRP